MLAVIVCGLINSGLLVGLLVGLVVGFVRGRVAIGDALAYDPFEPGVMPRRSVASA